MALVSGLPNLDRSALLFPEQINKQCLSSGVETVQVCEWFGRVRGAKYSHANCSIVHKWYEHVSMKSFCMKDERLFEDVFTCMRDMTYLLQMHACVP